MVKNPLATGWQASTHTHIDWPRIRGTAIIIDIDSDIHLLRQ